MNFAPGNVPFIIPDSPMTMTRQSALRFCLLLILPATVATAQWTRLPLYAGHADRLVQNKYKPNEIFAVVQNGGIYKSTDFGDTWSTVVNDLDLIWHSTYPGELAFEVTAMGDYLVSTDRMFYRSQDGGRTWQRDNRIGGSNYHHNFITHKDGKIFIDRSGAAYILASADSGRSFDTIRTPLFSSGAPWLNLLVDPEDSKRILIGGGGVNTELQLTSDGGVTWLKNPFPAERCSFQSIDRIPRADGYSFLMWVDQGSFDNSVQYILFRSDDSGRTWYRKNKTDLFAGNGGYWRYHFVAMYFGDTYVMSTWNAVFISHDAGVTWTRAYNQGIWDMVRVPAGVLASVTFDGIRLSTDTCAMWQDVPGTRAFPGSTKMEVATAPGGVVYAAVCDSDYLGYAGVSSDSTSHAELLCSSDGGNTWEGLFTSPWIDRLTVRYRVDARPFAVANRNLIVSVRNGRNTPDTLITVVGGVVRELQLGEAWPYQLVALLDYGGLYSYLFSTDGGEYWRQRGIPPGDLSECRIFPSSAVAGEYAAILRPNNVNDWAGMGVWRAVDSGATTWWTWMDRESDLQGRLFAMCDGGRLYRHDKKQFSRSYGSSWDYDTTGMSDADARQMFNLGWEGSMLARKGALLIGDPTGWLLYRDGSWRRLIDRTGRSIARDIPSQFDFTEDRIYAAFAKHGLYRTEVANVSTRAEPPFQPDELSLSCYPNPTKGIFLIRYRLPSASSGRLRVTDRLGSMVYECEVSARDGMLPVDFRSIAPRRLSSGLYFVHLYFESGHSISKPILYIE
jgi:photosystem II stability/assembly factor-like uncharacterized protein